MKDNDINTPIYDYSNKLDLSRTFMMHFCLSLADVTRLVEAYASRNTFTIYVNGVYYDVVNYTYVNRPIEVAYNVELELAINNNTHAR